MARFISRSPACIVATLALAGAPLSVAALSGPGIVSPDPVEATALVSVGPGSIRSRGRAGPRHAIAATGAPDGDLGLGLGPAADSGDSATRDPGDVADLRIPRTGPAPRDGVDRASLIRRPAAGGAPARRIPPETAPSRPRTEAVSARPAAPRSRGGNLNPSYLLGVFR